MHAATCLSARESTNKEVASQLCFLQLLCAGALASFSAPTWGKSLKCLGLSFSFSVLGCCGGWWLFVGAGMEGPFFATGPVAQWERPCHWCARRRCFITVYNDWRLESSLVRIYFGAPVFSGGGVVVLRWLLTF